jgi:hypothetical protein
MRYFILTLLFSIRAVSAIEPIFANVGSDLLVTVHFNADSCFTSSRYLFEFSKDKDALDVAVYKGHFTEQHSELYTKLATIQLTDKQIKGLDNLLRRYRELPPCDSTSTNTIKIEWNRPFMSRGKRIGVSTPLVETIFVDTLTEEEKMDFFTFSDVAKVAETQKEK